MFTCGSVLKKFVARTKYTPPARPEVQFPPTHGAAVVPPIVHGTWAASPALAVRWIPPNPTVAVTKYGEIEEARQGW